MINLIGILLLIIFEAISIMSIIMYMRYKLDLKDNEIAERDKTLSDKTDIIKGKNLKIKELKNEINEIKTRNRKRVR